MPTSGNELVSLLLLEADLWAFRHRSDGNVDHRLVADRSGILDEQPVETTLYSLGQTIPEGSERRTGERHLSLLRVGTLTIGDRRELCLIRNISAGGMLIRPYREIDAGTRVAIELKQGEPILGTARWTRDECVGVSFDDPIDVLTLLTASEDGPRPRMPRVEVDCTAWVRVGARVHRARALDISQGGLKISYRGLLPVKAEVVVSIAGLDPCHGVIRWNADGTCGITFNRVIPLPVLVAWLHDGRTRMRAAG